MANWWEAAHQGAPGMLLHTWSLSVEEQFYLVWPVLLYAVLRFWGRRAALGVSVGLSLLMTGHALAGVATNPYYRTDIRGIGLLLGASLALALSLGLSRRLSARTIRDAGLAGAGVLAVVIARVTVVEGMRGVGLTVIGLATAALILELVTHSSGLPARVLSASPLVWIGQRSYGVYLYHAVLLDGLHLNQGPLTLAISLPVSLGVADLSFRYLERPFLRLKGRVGAAHASESASAVALAAA
jgi:peptidoglycan/LPS O-acetylase OafA/YrhL